MAIVYQSSIPGKICANPQCGWKPLSEFALARSRGKPVGDGYKSRCRECWNAQKREERAANPEKYRETARKYVERKKQHIRELKRQHQAQNPKQYFEALHKYRTKHRNDINAKARERRRKNIEHYREIGRNSYERHAEERRKYSSEYYRRYPERGVAATNRRRALKLSAFSLYAPAATAKRIISILTTGNIMS